MNVYTHVSIQLFVYTYVYVNKGTRQSILSNLRYYESSLVVWIVCLRPKIMVKDYFTESRETSLLTKIPRPSFICSTST